MPYTTKRAVKTLGHGLVLKIFWSASMAEGVLKNYGQEVFSYTSCFSRTLILMGDRCSEEDLTQQRLKFQQG
jgi:hypothetical protein